MTTFPQHTSPSPPAEVVVVSPRAALADALHLDLRAGPQHPVAPERLCGTGAQAACCTRRRCFEHARIEAARGEMNRQLSALTPASRAKVLAYLDESGLGDDVALIEFFSDRAAKRAGGTT